VSGRLPVAIPPLAPLGAGMDLASLPLLPTGLPK
jgi:hypothetical protein